MKQNISKKTLSFSCSKKMEYLRTPPDIWENLKNEFYTKLCNCFM